MLIKMRMIGSFIPYSWVEVVVVEFMSGEREALPVP
jgi:hypothetical protein